MQAGRPLDAQYTAPLRHRKTLRLAAQTKLGERFERELETGLP